MYSIVVLVAILVALPLIGGLVRWGAILLFGGAIGARALAAQPDRIHLTRADSSVWRNPTAAAAIAGGLVPRGFKDAGVHRVQEMPGVVVQLLVHEAESLLAMIYEHPKAGSWFELLSRTGEGHGLSFSTSKPTGLKPRPTFPVTNCPGASPMDVLSRMRAERPSVRPVPVSVATAVRTFEDGYAESMAWRKSQGISRAEVAAVATRKAA